MKFFITGEVDAPVGEKIRLVIIQIEPKINTLFSKKNYGAGITYWGYITVCCAPEVYESGYFKEIRKYTKKENEVDLRLRVGYEEMLKADKKEVFRLICMSILEGVDIAEHELKIKDFDFQAFRDDLTSLFKKERWV